MFLALKEMRHAKGRYAMIITVVALVSYLVYFLTGLAWGLSNSFTQTVTNWNASSITLNQEANMNIMGSRINENEVQYDEKKTAPIGVAATSIPNESEEAKNSDDGGNKLANVFIFGYKPGTFVEPVVYQGKKIEAPYEAVGDPKLEKYGYKIGDKITIPTLDKEFKLVGFTASNSFQSSPSVFVNLKDFQDAGFLFSRDQASTISALVNKQLPGANPVKPAADADIELQTVDMSTYYDKIPGYAAQNMTFIFMIGSLIGILSLVLGIFMYVLTIQKKHIFGVLKARGVPASYLAYSGAMQTLLITAIGLTIGLGGTIISFLGLGGKLPFEIAPGIFALVTVLFIVFTLLGAIFPIRVINKIDPVKALG